MKKCHRGFTLIEITTVVAILALIAAISLPILIRARIDVNEAAAKAALLALNAAMQSYREAQAPPTYATSLSFLLNESPPYISSVFATGTKNGYRFEVASASADVYTITAVPSSSGITGGRTFLITEKGEILIGTGGAVMTGELVTGRGGGRGEGVPGAPSGIQKEVPP